MRGPKGLRRDGALAQNCMGGRGSEQLSPQTPQTPNKSLYLETQEGTRGNPKGRGAAWGRDGVEVQLPLSRVRAPMPFCLIHKEVSFQKRITVFSEILGNSARGEPRKTIKLLSAWGPQTHHHTIGGGTVPGPLPPTLPAGCTVRLAQSGGLPTPCDK